MINYSLILTTNYADKKWNIIGNEYDGLDWLDSTPKPTKEQLNAQWLEVQTKIADAATAKQVARQAVLDKLGLTANEAAALLG